MAWPPTGNITMEALQAYAEDEPISVRVRLNGTYVKGWTADEWFLKAQILDGTDVVGEKEQSRFWTFDINTDNFDETWVIATTARQTDPAKRLWARMVAKT